MSAWPRILGVGAVDGTRLDGTCGVQATWEELGVKPLGTGRMYRELFGKTDDTYRRLDRQTRALVLATEATGVDAILSPAEREDTALVIETTVGSIETDEKYTRSLDAALVHAAIFPYTLPSTCIGDVALRHAVRGPTLSISITPEERGEAMREARRLFQATSLRYALVGSVDALANQVPGAEPKLSAIVTLVAAPDADIEPVAEWSDRNAEPFAALVAATFLSRASE